MDDRFHDTPAATEAPGRAANPIKRKQEGRPVARGAALDHDARVALSTLERDDDGLYGILQVHGPTPETARRGLDAIRGPIEAMSSGPRSKEDLREVLLAANDRLLELNATLRSEPELVEKKLLRGHVTLLSRREGGFDAAYVGCQRVLAIRRGRLVGPVVRPQETTRDGQVFAEALLGSELRPDVALADVSAEGGDVIVIAGRTIVDMEEALDALLRASRGDGIQALANTIGAVVTIPVPGPLPAPEAGQENGLAWAALTSIGMRPRNEDAYRILGEAGIFVLGDGLGGHEDGALASRIGVDTVVEVYAAEGSWVAPQETSRRACELAGSRVARMTSNGGSTVEAVRIRDGSVEIAHMGDSRVYLFRDRQLSQQTTDHSLVAQKVQAGTLTPEAARTHPQRNIVTRALGSKFDPPDAIIRDFKEGDVLLLCSDGLTGPVDDDRIGSILRRARGDLGRAATALVDAAYDGGASDNVTVLLVSACDGRPRSSGRKTKARVRKTPPAKAHGRTTSATGL